MPKFIWLTAIMFLSGCVVGYIKEVEDLSPDIVSSYDDSVKITIGKYYTQIKYYDEITIDVMASGLQERFAQNNKGWLTLVFRKKEPSKTLWNTHLFDSSKLKIDIGKLKLQSSSPLSAQDGIFNVTELLNSTTNAALFITYNFTSDDYKSFGKLRFDGLIFDGEYVSAFDVDINNKELNAKMNKRICILMLTCL